jgi:hypothetical protein
VAIAHIIIENEHKQFGFIDIIHFLMKASSNTCQKRVIKQRYICRFNATHASLSIYCKLHCGFSITFFFKWRRFSITNQLLIQYMKGGPKNVINLYIKFTHFISCNSSSYIILII